jgi:hypothetical protein
MEFYRLRNLYVEMFAETVAEHLPRLQTTREATTRKRSMLLGVGGDFDGPSFSPAFYTVLAVILMLNADNRDLSVDLRLCWKIQFLNKGLY